jgi:hypothetical protein
MEEQVMDRRELLVLLGAAASAAPPKVDIANYRPRFFTAEEYRLLDAITDLLIPSDGLPGAREAGVGYYIDTVLFHGVPAAQQAWRTGLARVSREMILGTDGAARTAAMDLFASDPFFPTFRFLTVEAFALSDAGKRFFGYRGNTAIPEFPGCK